jgi:lysophospholipase L1-like esterase
MPTSPRHPSTLILWLVLPLALATHAFAQRQAPDHWVATWGTAQAIFRAAPAARGAQPLATPPPAATPPAVVAPPPVPPQAATPSSAAPGRRFPVPPQLPGVSNQTIRMVVRTSLGGSRVRVRLSNAFGAATVTLGSAAIARTTTGAGIDQTTSRGLTFSGQPAATIHAGQVLVSDPVDLAVPALTDLSVSLYFPGETGPPTTHLFGLRSTFISMPGDATQAPDITSPAATMQSYYWLAGVDVLAPAAAGTIVTFGDSITDGDQSTLDRITPWPSVLAARLQANRATAHLAVVNAGISGNRILGDNGSGLSRLVHDALAQPGVAWLTLLEGINDITGAMRQPPGTSTFSATTLIGAYRQVIAQAHLRGIRVAGCTLTPFGGSSAFSERGEAIRQEVNAWIRTSGEFDAVIDFDRATRDPQDPRRFRAEADSPDLLHPGDAGYRLMAEAIDLRVFTAPARQTR